MSLAQSKLYEAMKAGVIVIFMTGKDAHAFRTDTHRDCTKQIFALERLKLVERYDVDWRGCRFKVKGGAQ